MQKSLIPHSNSFRLYHIVFHDANVTSGSLRPMKTTSVTAHDCSISPKGNALSRCKGATQVYCPDCARGVEVVTVDDTFAKFPSETLLADKELRKTLVFIITRKLVALCLIIYAIIFGFIGIVFFLRTLVLSGTNFATEARVCLFFALGILLVFLIIIMVLTISNFIAMRRGAIVSFDKTPTKLLDKVIAKSPYNLHRVVTSMTLKNTFAHQLAYSAQTFTNRSFTICWRVDDGLFGGSERCYVDSEYNDTVPTVRYQPTGICLSFDTRKIDDSSYGKVAWFTFWDAIKDKDLSPGTRLYCGDLVGIDPKLYGIFIESDSQDSIAEIKKRFSSNKAYREICGELPFADAASPSSEGLVHAGTIDSLSVLVGGDSDWARVELSSVKLPDLKKVYTKDAAIATPPRRKPASSRTKGVQPIAGISELKNVLKSTFPSEGAFVSILPEEVCDLVDACEANFFVAWELSGIVYTESFVELYFMERDGEQRAFRLQGMFNFPSASDVDRFIREYIGYSRTFLNLTGITALNFIGPKDMEFNDNGKQWMFKDNLSGDLLWKYIHLRKVQLGLVSESANAAEISAPHG